MTEGRRRRPDTHRRDDKNQEILSYAVIPAEAGIQALCSSDGSPPPPAGMTEKLVMPDSGYRASILWAFRMDPRLPLAGMTTGESSHFQGICPHVYALTRFRPS
jgi:hypothetical protein